MSHDPTRTRVWVVGGGGLLGSALTGVLDREGYTIHSAERVPWNDDLLARRTLRTTLAEFIRQVADDRWGILWCAGAGVTGTSAERLDVELALFRDFVDAVEQVVPAAAERGRLFLASSAGGAYSGSEQPPFDEHTEVRPTSPYGRTKLGMERAVSEASARLGLPCLIGRIANIYGPGQDLAKPQGLVSQLCRADLSGDPLPLYADLGTLRDYLYVDDCAEMIAASLWGPRALVGPAHPTRTKVYCSGAAVSIDEVLGTFESTFGHRAPVAVEPADASSQILDLRLVSRVGEELQELVTTPLTEGFRAVMASVEQRVRSAGAPDPS